MAHRPCSPARPVRAGRCARVSPPGGRAAEVRRTAHTPIGVPPTPRSWSTPAKPRSGRCRRVAGSAPTDEANGDEPASFTAARREEPKNHPAKAAIAARPDRSRRRHGAGDAGWQRCRAVTADGAWACRSPATTVVPAVVPATPASSATCSATSAGGCPPPTAWPARGRRQRRGRPTRHHDPRAAQSATDRVTVTGPGRSARPISINVQPRPARRQSGRREGRRDPWPRRRRRGRRRAGRRRTAHRRRVRPRGDLQHRPARWHRDPALPHHRRLRADARLRAARPAGRLRRQGRPGRPRLPDRGARRWRRDPPAAPDQAGALAGQAGLHRRAARGRDARGGRGADPASRSTNRRRARRRRPQRPLRQRGRRRDFGTRGLGTQVARRRDRLPDRHRAHLHGRRGPRGCRREGRHPRSRSRPRARPAPRRSRPRRSPTPRP